jgi:DNA-binding response OmpR family regulator
MARILVIDDDELLRRFVVALLERRSYNVTSTDSGETGIKLAGEEDFDLVITDIVMPGTEGLETIKQIRRHKPEMKILAVSGGGSSKGDYRHYAERLGANAALAKPFEPAEFLGIVAGLVKPADAA